MARCGRRFGVSLAQSPYLTVVSSEKVSEAFARQRAHCRTTNYARLGAGALREHQSQSVCGFGNNRPTVADYKVSLEALAAQGDPLWLRLQRKCNERQVLLRGNGCTELRKILRGPGIDSEVLMLRWSELLRHRSRLSSFTAKAEGCQGLRGPLEAVAPLQKAV